MYYSTLSAKNRKHRLAKTGQEKIGKMLHGLMSFNFCCNIWMLKSDQYENLVPSWLISGIQTAAGVWDILLKRYGFLSPNRALFKHQCFSLKLQEKEIFLSICYVNHQTPHDTTLSQYLQYAIIVIFNIFQYLQKNSNSFIYLFVYLFASWWFIL